MKRTDKKLEQTPRPSWEATMFTGHGTDTGRYTKNEIQPTILYFAYGSNLKRSQMLRRCPDSVPVQALTLHGFKLVFKGAADIVPDENSYVVGAVYRISVRDRRSLDKFEGFRERDPRSGSYRAEWFYISSGTGERTDARDPMAVPVLIYRKNTTEESAPTTEYYDRVRTGFDDWNLPLETLLEARRNCPVYVPKYKSAYVREGDRILHRRPKGVIRSTEDTQDPEGYLISSGSHETDAEWFARLGITDPFVSREEYENSESLNEDLYRQTQQEWEEDCEAEEEEEEEEEDEITRKSRKETLSTESYTHLCESCNRPGYEDRCWYCSGNAVFID